MFQIDAQKNVPIYEQIIWRIKEMCLRGVLRPGEKLPSVRELSTMIVVNPNTVSKAYQELERQGVILTRPGKGTFVAAAPPREANTRLKAVLKERLRLVSIEAVYAGLTLEEVQGWLQEQFSELGGNRGA